MRKNALLLSLTAACAVASLAGCTFTVSYEASHYTCESDGTCPIGFSCGASGYCELPGDEAPDAAVTPDVAPLAPDAAPLPDAEEIDVVPDAASPDAAPPCTGDVTVTDPDGHCYALFLTPQNFIGAHNACVALGGELAIVADAGENALIAGLFAGAPTIADAWLGGTDVVTEMQWIWLDGTAVVFDNWRLNEPNNGATSGIVEHCMVMELDVGGTWDDRPCANSLPYVCERP